MECRRIRLDRGGVPLAVTDCGGFGQTVLLLHGLTGSSTELLPTARALVADFRVLLLDQRGHGRSARRPDDVSRQAFVDDVVHVLEAVADDTPAILVGHSMGAHTALLTASARPDLVERLVILEGHARGSHRSREAQELGSYLATWPATFPDVEAARRFLGDSALAQAWVEDLEAVEGGLRRRFDGDVMERTLRAMSEPIWLKWEQLRVPTLAVFAEHGMFAARDRDELISRRPDTRRVDLVGATHDAHLDSFASWVVALRGYLTDSIVRRSPGTESHPAIDADAT